jgi:hypothetical protein
MKHAVVLMLAIMMMPLHAAPFEKGDPKTGKALHEKSCLTCHSTSMYTRANRTVKTSAQLSARISGCNANTGAGWFPEEEQNVAAYLNHNLYHFNK